MQQKLMLLSACFIVGIIIGMGISLPHVFLPPLGGLGIALLALSLMLSASGRRSLLIMIIGGVLLGWTNFSWRVDTTSPYHLVHYADDVPFVDKTEVGGRIIKEPEVRQFKTIVTIRPEYVRTEENGPALPVTGGLVQLELRPTMRRTYDLYEYGDYIVVRYTELTRPDPATNPGIFDYRRFLQNNDVYGLMRLRKDYQMQRIDDRRHDNFFVSFALDLKKDLLYTIKKTMPYPESAFLGGIMLGLRQGLSRTIQDEFRAAGVAHVLAVSGLHVTIITALLFGILTLFRVPRKYLAPPIILGLIIFAIITGARPSTLRAVIMNSISLLSFCYLAAGLKRSLLFGICMAAMIILFFTPMILFEASFLYSFMAVLALATLTGPLLSFFNRTLVSLHAIFLFLLILVMLGAATVDYRTLFVHPPNAFFYLAILFGLSWLCRGFIPRSVRFSRLPYWFTSFTAAQAAIQLGLGPLNAFYFQKYSLAAPLANFIAIPLIGVNVQLGIIAGILGFIPLIGDYLAIVVNAANYLMVKLFLGSASFFAHAIPYPDVTPPPMWVMLVYYVILIFIAYNEQILDWIRIQRIRYRIPMTRPEMLRKVKFATIVLVLFIFSVTTGFLTTHDTQMRITVLDLNVFGMGGGTAQILEFPDDRTMVIDGGVAVVKKKGNVIPWNMGSMIVAPVLRAKRINELDWVVLTSPDSEACGGIAPLLESFYVSNFVDTLPFGEDVRSDLDLTTFLQVIDDDYFTEKADTPLVQETYNQYGQLLSTAQAKNIPITVAQRGMTLFQTVIGGRNLSVTVLHPPDTRLKGFRTVTNNSCVLKVSYGNFSCLLPSLITIDAQKDLLTLGADVLRADVMIAPYHGYKGSLYSDFVKAVNPRIIIMQTTADRWKERDIARNTKIYEDLGCTVLRTDLQGAVTISSNGDGYSISTMLPGTAAETDRVLGENASPVQTEIDAL